MADADDSTPRVSRRMWIAGLGGGLVAAPFLYVLGGGAGSDRRAGNSTDVRPYVDQDGWMLTPDDVAAIAARRSAQ